jgi:catechol 2,3-dioxygenase-like lactoylglutathione lyase family enzyme
MGKQKIVPELYCSDIGQSLSFYLGVCGFEILFERPEERFAYLSRDAAELMLEQPTDTDRTFLAAVPEYPYGRGMNLQIEVGDIDMLHERVVASRSHILLPLEERWYRVGDVELGHCQFVVMDPDGYLLRFFRDLGSRKTV